MNVKYIVFFFILSLIGKVKNNEPVDTTYYDLLNVTVTASQQEIRQAYKRLVIKLHPDKNPNPDQSVQDKFVKVSEAYETLKDPDKRRQYDIYGVNKKNDHGYNTYQSQSEYNNLYFKGLYFGDLHVDNLGGKNYFAYLSEGFHFVNFYSPFCPPCQKLSGSWKKLAESFKDIVKVGAVNCKYQNDFCRGKMRISSYPSLFFYHNGKNHYYQIYRGDRTYEALEQYVMRFITNEVSIIENRVVSLSDKPTVYILGDAWLHEYSTARIAYQLKNFARVVKVTDDALRKKLASDEYVTVLVEFDGKTIHTSATDETEILQFVTTILDDVPAVTMETLPEIRNKLRSDTENEEPWVIYFKNKELTDKVLLQRLKHEYPDLKFGEMDCDVSQQLCASLQVEQTPAWGVLKPGGAFQLSHDKPHFPHVAAFVRTASHTRNVHTLSVSEFNRIFDGEGNVWVIAVVPFKLTWDHLVDTFTEASKTYKDIQFGIMRCQKTTAQYCRNIALHGPAIIIQNRTQRFLYDDESDPSLSEFIAVLKDNSAHELTEDEYKNIFKGVKSFSHAIAFFPELCDAKCQQLKYEWILVSKKSAPVKGLKVSFVDCSSSNKNLCQPVIRSPILRLYPASSPNNYFAQLLSLNKAAYILEWMLNVIDDSIQHLTRHNFAMNVWGTADDLGLPHESNLPWLVYFHSPRCHHCYEMFTDFYITGQMLKNKVKLGKVNCLQERGICSQERIMSYPSIKLYTKQQSTFRTHFFEPDSYNVLVDRIDQHIPIQFQKASIGANHEFKHNEL